jgi:S1-C subfamily serine protease
MKKIIFIGSILASFFFSITALALNEVDVYKSVVKIRNYTYNSTSDTYTVSSIGSAVSIGKGLLLTNAHVIFDEDQMVPSGFYEVCRTIDFRKKTVCFTTANLIAYDESEDLALLQFTHPSDLPIAPIFQEKRVNIWANLVIYGYPSIGGENITRTEGKVAGFEDAFYKIDGAIDHGNSGGGAFNKYGQLTGVPSRVSSDNAVIGYMIPITTIHDFLAKKTKGYKKSALTATKSFKDFIRVSQIGERSKDIISDINIKTLSLKKFGLKFGLKLDGTRSFLYSFNLSNLSENALLFWCFQLSGDLSLAELDERDEWENIKKYKKTTEPITTSNGRFLVEQYESLVATDGRDKVNIYDLDTTCAAYLPWVSIKKDMDKIQKAIAFVTSGVTLKKTHKKTTSFDAAMFHIETLPFGISLATSPGYGGDDSIMLGYFSTVANTGETLEYIDHKKRDTLDSYFLWSNSFYDMSPSDVTLKPEEYSFETYKKIYEKEYTGEGYSNAQFSIAETINKKKILVGTVEYREPKKPNASVIKYIIVAYPYMITQNGKTEYHELTYSNGYEGDATRAISALRSFFTGFEPVGSAPF